MNKQSRYLTLFSFCVLTLSLTIGSVTFTPHTLSAWGFRRKKKTSSPKQSANQSANNKREIVKLKNELDRLYREITTSHPRAYDSWNKRRKAKSSWDTRVKKLKKLGFKYTKKMPELPDGGTFKKYDKKLDTLEEQMKKPFSSRKKAETAEKNWKSYVKKIKKADPHGQGRRIGTMPKARIDKAKLAAKQEKYLKKIKAVEERLKKPQFEKTAKKYLKYWDDYKKILKRYEYDYAKPRPEPKIENKEERKARTYLEKLEKLTKEIKTKEYNNRDVAKKWRSLKKLVEKYGGTVSFSMPEIKINDVARNTKQKKYLSKITKVEKALEGYLSEKIAKKYLKYWDKYKEALIDYGYNYKKPRPTPKIGSKEVVKAHKKIRSIERAMLKKPNDPVTANKMIAAWKKQSYIIKQEGGTVGKMPQPKLWDNEKIIKKYEKKLASVNKFLSKPNSNEKKVAKARAKQKEYIAILKKAGATPDTGPTGEVRSKAQQQMDKLLERFKQVFTSQKAADKALKKWDQLAQKLKDEGIKPGPEPVPNVVDKTEAKENKAEALAVIKDLKKRFKKPFNSQDSADKALKKWDDAVAEYKKYGGKVSGKKFKRPTPIIDENAPDDEEDGDTKPEVIRAKKRLKKFHKALVKDKYKTPEKAQADLDQWRKARDTIIKHGGTVDVDEPQPSILQHDAESADSAETHDEMGPENSDGPESDEMGADGEMGTHDEMDNNNLDSENTDSINTHDDMGPDDMGPDTHDEMGPDEMGTDKDEFGADSFDASANADNDEFGSDAPGNNDEFGAESTDSFGADSDTFGSDQPESSDEFGAEEGADGFDAESDEFESGSSVKQNRRGSRGRSQRARTNRTNRASENNQADPYADSEPESGSRSRPGSQPGSQYERSRRSGGQEESHGYSGNQGQQQNQQYNQQHGQQDGYQSGPPSYDQAMAQQHHFAQQQLQYRAAMQHQQLAMQKHAAQQQLMMQQRAAQQQIMMQKQQLARQQQAMQQQHQQMIMQQHLAKEKQRMRAELQQELQFRSRRREARRLRSRNRDYDDYDRYDRQVHERPRNSYDRYQGYTQHHEQEYGPHDQQPVYSRW